MYVQSIKSVKHNAAKFVNRSIFKGKPTNRVRCLYSSFFHGGVYTETDRNRAWIVQLESLIVDENWFPEAQFVIVLSLEVNNCSGSLPANEKPRFTLESQQNNC